MFSRKRLLRYWIVDWISHRSWPANPAGRQLAPRALVPHWGQPTQLDQNMVSMVKLQHQVFATSSHHKSSSIYHNIKVITTSSRPNIEPNIKSSQHHRRPNIEPSRHEVITIL
jgi:hypothetical protein